MQSRRPSVLSYRPKTSSALDDDTSTINSGHTMKRTASQVFSPGHYGVHENGTLCPVNESSMGYEHDGGSQHSHTMSLSRAISSVTSFTRSKSRRRLSSCSTTAAVAPRRRGSLQSFMEALPSSSSTRKNSMERAPLHHQDSGIPTFPLQPQPSNSKSHTLYKRFNSMRRRPAASGPSGEPAMATMTMYPSQTAPGSAARQAAAAANQDRQQREQELLYAQRFINGQFPTSARDDELKDDESGVGMDYVSGMVRADSVTDKKMNDPFERLPAELATAVLSNLDATSLVSAESVSRGWRKLASSKHVWRNVFLRQFEPEVHVSPAPIQMGGTGIGGKVNGNPAPGQQWKEMYAARAAINRNWKAGKPAAIYMNGHTDSVYCCQFDEHKAITGSRDRTIRVWDLKTYECVKVYGGPNHRPQLNTPPPMEQRPECVVSHPSLNGTEVGHEIYVVPSDYHDASILCLQYDDEIMVTGSSDYTCIVWDVTGDEYVPMHRLRGHEAGVLDVCLDDKYMISCSKDAMIKIWDRKTGVCIRTLKGHRGPVNAVQLRGHFLVSASGDGMAKLWNLETGLNIKDFASEDRGLAAVEFSDDAKYVLAGGNDHVVYKFDAATGNLVHSRVKHEGLVRSLFLDAFNGRIISGSYDQSIQVSDYDTGVPIAMYKNWTTSWILSAKSDYRRVVATSQDGRILILDFGWGVDGRKLLVGKS